MAISTERKTAIVGNGQWVHISDDGKTTLCGISKNVRPTDDDVVTCMRCLKRLF